mmetsp:Transcript_14136/g.20905  ORF Transcript_14136/g.20905 Transcript_14136/m.20905 type:complete len:128 (-) Transcript_14136:577-960(-)
MAPFVSTIIREQWNHCVHVVVIHRLIFCVLPAKLIEEFEDVSPKEKTFMKLWNRFIKCHTVIPDSVIPGKCMDFIRLFATELFENDLRSQFLLHLFNLWDHQLVSSEHILKSLRLYDELKKSANGVH